MDIEEIVEVLDELDSSLHQTVAAGIYTGIRIADHINGTKTDRNKFVEVLVAISRQKLNVVPSTAELQRRHPWRKDLQSIADYNQVLDYVVANLFIDRFLNSK